MRRTELLESDRMCLGLLVNFAHYPKVQLERVVSEQGRYGKVSAFRVFCVFRGPPFSAVLRIPQLLFAGEPVQQHFEFEPLDLTQPTPVSFTPCFSRNTFAGVDEPKRIPLIPW